MAEENIQGFWLSPLQKRLWVQQQSAQHSPFWARCQVRIQGNLNEDVFEKAVVTAAKEHEILRTSFKLLPGMTLPVQAISEDLDVSLKLHDLSLLSRQEQVETVRDLYSCKTDSIIAYDRALLCLDIARLAHDERVFILKVPALCADRPSLEILISQIADSYKSLLRSEPSSAPAGMQYADFAEWQNELLESPESAPARKHWDQDDLFRALTLSLPFEKLVSAKTAFQPASVSFDIAPEMARRITEQANSTGERFAVFILACWQTLLWRLTGYSNLTVGMAFEGRKYAELENSVGLHSRYVPIVVQSPNCELRFDRLQRLVGEAEREGAKWQEYFSLENIHGSSAAAGEGYFSFCFEERNVVSDISVADVSFSICRRESCIDRFKLKLICESSDHSARLELHYDSTFLEEEDIQRLCEELSTLIDDSSRRPETPIAQLQVIGSHERQRIIKEFNDTKREYQALCIHKLFEAQVVRAPNNPAIVFGSIELTYAQLNNRANQIGHRLRKLGVGPDTTVGLCLERSVDFIVGLLGILKAGGAYLPLDPGLPDERLSLMLNEASAGVLLTRHSRADFPSSRTVYLPSDPEGWDQEDSTNCESEVRPENLAYVIFTSGSTGKPKGVGVEHRQLFNYIHAIEERLDLSESVCFGLVSTLTADLAHTVLFPSLTKGKTLHLISEEEAMNPEAIADYFKRNLVDCLKIVPSHLGALLSTSHPEDILPRQRLVLGGEVCTLSLLARIEGLNARCTVWNHYGPTEATVGCLAERIDFEQARSLSAVPIGQPLANTTAYILDQRFQSVPIGAPGILYIGGKGLARGYMNRPESTAESFVPDPFCEEAGGRLYKTGDRARYLRDGRIEFLGRADDQLKVHGYRIEPREIESALREHQMVEQCVVIGREDRPAEKRLVAYFVVKGRRSLTVAELRDFLTARLPNFMIPAAFVPLENLPLTPNGKINRDALPPPEFQSVTERFVAPRSHFEQVLASIWSNVLGTERIGVHDNFFELGGDSILSIQIIARANQAGLGLAPRQIFQHQTIAELAKVTEESFTQKAEQGLVTGEVPLTPIQASFLERDQSDRHYYNQARLLKLREAPDPSRFERAVKHLIVHHDALRLRFLRTDTGWKQTNSAPDAEVPFESIDVSHLSPSEIPAAIEETAVRLQGSLNLHEGPIIRVALFNGGVKSPGYLLVIIHHLAVDGVSWRILLEDLESVYRQLESGTQISLPPKTTSFKLWADRLADYAQSDALLDELPYWLSLFSKPHRRLPIDQEGANSVASRRTVTVSLTAEETDALLHNFPVSYKTQINEVLLTALVRTFRQWTGSSSLLLDLEGHGREEIIEGMDVSRTIGWFTSVFPVVLDVEESLSPIDGLRCVKEQLRAIPHRGIGYGLLRYSSDRAAVKDQLRALCNAEIRFNYLGQQDRLLPDSSIFRFAQHSSGPSQSQKAQRVYLLNIIGAVTNGKLRLDWTYSKDIHRTETLERLARTYLEELRGLLAQSGNGDARSYSPSDFPGAKVSQEDLNKVLAKFRA
jgi:amino acid adenylation domain-containing protein/non-ribosomal peptide synthase protein (TIGR01720 family)